MMRSGVVRGLCLAVLALIVPACGGGSDDAAPVDSVQFSAATFSVNEASGLVTISVTRGAAGAAATVNYATSNGTATQPGDYTATAGTLTWAAGDASTQTFDVPVLTDGATEGDETINLTLSLASGGAKLGAQSQATVLLSDANAPADGVFQFSSATYTVCEAAATVQATITVTRTSGSSGAVVANVQVSDGTAVAATDYTAPVPNPVVLNWADGDSAAKTFTIDIVPNAVAGAPVKTVALALTAPAQAPAVPVVGTLAAATLNIVDHDVPGTVAFVSAAQNVFESGVESTFTVRRINGCGGAGSVEVNVTAGTAVAGTDYTVPVPNPIVLNWADGDIADKTVTIAVLDNAVIDGTRTVNLALQNPGGVATSAPTAAVLSILDDEPGSLAFTTATFSVAEGNAGTVNLVVSVTRSGGSLGAASVQVVDAGGGSATSGGDYTAVGTPTLNWANGESGAKTLNIVVNGDGTVETDETINLSLQNAVGGVLGIQTTAVATITNDDVPNNGQFQFDPAGVYTVAESAGTITINVQRVGGTTGAVSVTIATSNGTARSNGNPNARDFVASGNVVLNWAAGDAAPKSLVVTINPNTTTDAASEFFNVTLSAATGGATITGTNPRQVTITDP